MRVSGYMSLCVCAWAWVCVCLSVCVCACTVCMCVLYWPYNNQTVFTKIGKTRKYLRLLLSSFFPHFPLLPRSSSVASGAYAFFITYTYTCWIPLRPLTPPTLLRSPLSTRISEFVSMSGASCVVQNMRIRCRLPCIHQHVMRRQQLPLSTCHLPLLQRPPPSPHPAASARPQCWRVCSKCQ